jgi:hypothetical protein
LYFYIIKNGSPVSEERKRPAYAKATVGKEESYYEAKASLQ